MTKHDRNALRPFLVERLTRKNCDWVRFPNTVARFALARTPKEALEGFVTRTSMTKDDLRMRVRVTYLSHGDALVSEFLPTRDYIVQLERRVVTVESA